MTRRLTMTGRMRRIIDAVKDATVAVAAVLIVLDFGITQEFLGVLILAIGAVAWALIGIASGGKVTQRPGLRRRRISLGGAPSGGLGTPPLPNARTPASGGSLLPP
jgi:hypothetical protein